MSEKQDRTYARTAQDIERKYSFGKTFADMLGLINENRDKVDSVESSLFDEITKTSTNLKRDTEQVVIEAKKEVTSLVADVDERVTELSSEVTMKLDADAVSILVEKEIANGVDRVETKTGYVFDDSGLNISKSDSEISNLLDHEGMRVQKNGDDILVANKDGVDAKDLHAKTYLIIGEGEGRSRFEDYSPNRTGCFWIGG
ncbi:MAG: hypothetical protein E7540_02120 [Ruminococcaceae bacterium]|nr:hypothetical protein [Oscillospiraceae bacterium]